MNSYFPVLNHLFQTKKGHPEALLSVMSSMACALTPFSLKLQPRDLPAYDQPRGPRPLFYRSGRKASRAFGNHGAEQCDSLPLKLVQPSVYATALADDKHLVKTMHEPICAPLR